jgi:hypothetical protein
VVQALRAPPPEVVSWINEEPKRIEHGSGLSADELRRLVHRETAGMLPPAARHRRR